MWNKYVNKLFQLSPTIEHSERKPLRALITVMVLAIAWCVLFFSFFLIAGSTWMATMAVIYATIGAILIAILKRTGGAALFTALFTLELISFLLMSIYHFSWEFGFHLPLLVIFLFIFLPKYKYSFYPILVSLIAYASIVLGYFVIQNLNVEQKIYSHEILDTMYLANITVTCVALAIMSKLFQLDTQLSEDLVIQEKRRSEDLLHNILPISIATRLKNDNQIIADGFENVSIMFVDIVGFTKLSEVISPNEVVSLLNNIFTEFDRLVEKYGLEKIKTIGDAYMVSGGLPEHHKDHLEKMALMALDMMETTQKIKNQTSTNLQIRAGIHAGPVVAGVIGVKKFAYDLWGDSVNTASRMESHGLPGKINVTESVKEKLQDKFEFEKRELIEIKSKGMMQTYFLIGLKKR